MSSSSVPPLRSGLRVNTDMTSFSRNRSYSAAQPPPQPLSATSLGSTSSGHHMSRSFSHAGDTRSPSDGSTPLNTLRSASSDLYDSSSSASFSGEGLQIVEEGSPSSPREGEGPPGMKEMREALQRSVDMGDTMDLSRRRITTIGDDEAEMLRRGVGKDRKGVWRWVGVGARQLIMQLGLVLQLAEGWVDIRSVLPPESIALPKPQRQQLQPIPRSGACQASPLR